MKKGRVCLDTGIVDCKSKIMGLLACLCGLIGATSMQPAPAEEYVSDDWQFEVTPYLWALSLKGDVTAKGQTSEVDIGFDTIFENLNFALMLEANARKGRFGLFVNPLYAILEDKINKGPVRTRVDIDLAIASFGGYYRLGPWDLSADASGPKLVADLYAGGRYTHLDVTAKFRDVGLKVGGVEDWIDPLVGVQTLWFLSPKWTLEVHSDYGFGSGSNYQWQATGLLGYNVKLWGDDNARIYAGYRYLRQDYTSGSGSNKFEWDVKLHGPTMGLTYHF